MYFKDSAVPTKSVENLDSSNSWLVSSSKLTNINSLKQNIRACGFREHEIQNAQPKNDLQ